MSISFAGIGIPEPNYAMGMPKESNILTDGLFLTFFNGKMPDLSRSGKGTDIMYPDYGIRMCNKYPLGARPGAGDRYDFQGGNHEIAAPMVTGDCRQK